MNDICKNKRVPEIDFLRGGAMVLVLLHHSMIPGGDYILAFHMPLFFAISGYLMKIEYKYRIKERIRRLFYRVMIPYFGFELINYLIYVIKCFVDGNEPLYSSAFISIITCINNEYIGMYGRLWFFPCLFVSEIYALLLLRCIGDSVQKKVALINVLLILSFVTSKVVGYRLPFTLDTALFATAFIFMGMICKEFKSKIVTMLNYRIMTICFILLVYCVKCHDAVVLMYVNQYGNYFYSIIAAVSGVIFFVMLCNYIYIFICNHNCGCLRNVIMWYGNNSLCVFPIHLSIKMMIIWYVTLLKPWYSLFLMMFLFDIPLVNIISKYCPMLVGNLNRKHF